MNSRLPTFTAHKLTKILKKLGLEEVRSKGSHRFYRHGDGRTTVVPFHSGKDIGRGLMRAIMEDIQFTSKDLQKEIGSK